MPGEVAMSKARKAVKITWWIASTAMLYAVTWTGATTGSGATGIIGLFAFFYTICAAEAINEIAQS